MNRNSCPFGPHLQSYWDRRYQLFSRFDEGVQLDEEGLYSAKPEASALSIGRMIEGRRILDAFCGVGASAIGLARAGKKVIASDINRERLEMARHNAGIYGVGDRIEFVHGDAVRAMDTLQYDAIYLDPPWGGIDYDRRERFPLSGLAPDGEKLLRAALSHTGNVSITVPPNFDLWEISRFRNDFYTVYDWMNDEAIYLTVFFNRGHRACNETHRVNSSHETVRKPREDDRG